ncbi:MAG: hypothetical protein WCK59_03375 [Candidatus Falkowbacteria bacterium]
MEKIIVDRNTPFSFPEEVVAMYGAFEIRQSNEVAAKISEFTIDDLEIIRVWTSVTHRASEFQKMILDAGRIPLDSYCAKAIYENKIALRELELLAFDLEMNYPEDRLETLMFLGDTVSRDENDINHFSFILFHPFSREVEFMPYEDDPSFMRTHDFPMVFKKEFIAKL